MSIEQLGNIGELISAIAVLITLIYLAIQLRAMNRIAQVDGHRDLIKQLNQHYEKMKEPLLMNILLKGSEDFDALSGQEQLTFETYMHSYFHICEQAWYMGRNRYVPAGSYDAFMNAAVALSSHGALRWWQNAKPTFADDFVAMIDERRASTPELPPLREFMPTYMYGCKIGTDA